MNYSIVIARFNEDISWTSEYKNVQIYNKGTDLNNFETIKLDNVGREGHTYIKYIVDNYKNLPDYVIFLQGNPFDHLTDFKTKLVDLIKNIDNKNNIKDFISFSNFNITTNFFNKNESYMVDYPNFDLSFKYIYNRYPLDYSKEFTFSAGAQFCVSKKLIILNDLSLYKKILGLFENNMDNNFSHLLHAPFSNSINLTNPIFGYHLERFWPIIFSNMVKNNEI